MAAAEPPAAALDGSVVPFGSLDADTSQKASTRAKEQSRSEVVHALGKTVRLTWQRLLRGSLRRTIYATINMFPFRARRENVRCRWTLCQRRRRVRVRNYWFTWGVRAIPFGIATMFLTFVLKLALTQVTADIGPAVSRISVFGTIHPDIFRFRAPLGSGPDFGRLQLASVEPQVEFDRPVNRLEVLADTSVLPWGNVSLDERFAAFDRASPFGIRITLGQ